MRVGVPSFVEKLATGWRPILLLTALCAVLFLPGLSSIPATDRDEARFMQATKQMLESGDLVSIQFQDEPRTKKPVGIHWLQVLSVKLGASDDLLAVWAYRLPSTLAAWLSVLCIFFAGRRAFNAQAGLLAALLTACTLILMIEAHLAKTDSVLLLTIVVAQVCLLKFYTSDRDSVPGLKTVLTFWAALGLGILIKGPVICAVLLATLLALWIADRDMRWLRGLSPKIGVPVAMAIVLPWVLATFAAGNGDVITASLTEDFIPKLLGGTEGHGALPGTHTFLAPVTLWPSSLILLPGLLMAWKCRDQPAIRFALAWSGATWLMFELVPTKLPHYILPAVPALALAVSGSLKSLPYEVPRWSIAVWSAIATALAGVLIWASAAYDGTLMPPILLGGALVVIIGLIASARISSELAAPLTAGVFALAVFSGTLPGLSSLALSERLATSVNPHSTTPNPRVALSQYHEPSAVFLLGTETWLTNARNSAAHIAADPRTFAGIAPDHLSAVTEIVESLNGTLIVVDRISGFNYSKGRPETVVLVRSAPRTDAP